MKSRLLVQNKYIKKIVDKFIYNVWDQQLSYNDGKWKFPLGKIAGDEDKSRHMKRYDQPFECIEKIIILITWLNKMSYDHQCDQ